MSIPLSQAWTVAQYVLSQKLKGKTRFPLVLMLEPLFKCNLSCSRCGKIGYPKEILNQQLSSEQCFRAVDECGAPVVSIPGGEPLLHPEIDIILKGLINRKKYTYLCTNGQILKDKLNFFTPSKFLTFSVHLDGPMDTHDRLVGKRGAYEKAIEAIRAALQRGFRVTTNTTLFTDTNIEMLFSFFDEMTDLGVESITISPGYDFNGSPENSSFLNREKTIKLFSEILSNAKGRWNFNQSPLFLEFLMGKRNYECTPWGNPTYNIFGWQKPCYLINEGYVPTFKALMEETEWQKYGKTSGNKKCCNCMVHSGYEATAVIDTLSNFNALTYTLMLLLFGYKKIEAIRNLKKRMD